MSDKSGPAGTNFARAYYDGLAGRLRQGLSHNSLGANLKKTDDWWAGGKPKFEKLLRTFRFGSNDRVIDYGCGSLRVGAHFIRYLESGRYFGLDVSAGLIDIGKELLGEALLCEKAPRLAVIDEGSLAEATEFAADFVFSWAVAYHVHPDENAYYLENLARITHKRKAVLLIDTKTAKTAFKYGRYGWARPLDVYQKALSPLTFVKMHNARPAEEGDKNEGSTAGTLEFRRA